ncbi:uncharacterized protein LOC130787291 isoform X2 [Actinidia eriantha]|uniref:uncharacterized protein LOC130787291 isoform X1 n=1 Tax=Actinidia eriantha TaxID=165200 RepID=UPI0025880D82|nr:uncharacterized protein LOC130787291 isoform X1 [Actinidia eriantha]XP_057503666.1 uncharacterized protein LOC130787291 isoform X2 [Actinidia eriantha]
MGKKKKKFIDKKKSATFQILARDTSDPNYSDSPSGDRVFVRVDNNNAYSVDTFFDEHNDTVSGDDRFADAPDDYDEEDDGGEKQLRAPPPSAAAAAALPDHVRREILELGFPDDGYNYLTHLREIKNTGGGSVYYHNSKAKLDQLPRDVKAYDASRVEIYDLHDDSNEKSIYSVASRTVGVRIQKAVDPEVVALLDDSDLSRFGSDDEDLEEDFVVKANLPDELEDIDLNKKLNLVENSEVNLKEIDQSNASHSQDNVVDFVEAIEFRNHQLISGEYHSNENPRACRLLDEQFDMLVQQEYGTDGDGDNDYDNFMAEDECHESLAEKLNHALKNRTTADLELNGEYKVPADLLHNKEKPENAELVNSAADVIRKCMEYAEMYEHDDPDEDVMVVEESSDESEVWDCETIVSTYSNLDNHPGKIEAPEVRRKKKLAETVSGALNASSHVISLKGKAKLPVDYLPQAQNKKYAVENVKDVTASGMEPQTRKQHGQESKEEKKERKIAVKEERREARRVKKEMKELYKGEAQRAQRVAAFTGPSSIHLM